jgi:hypothetical protein
MNPTNPYGKGFAILVQVIPVTGISEPSFLSGPKTAWVRAAADANDDAALVRAVDAYPLLNARLLALADRYQPPQSWYDENHEGLY